MLDAVKLIVLGLIMLIAGLAAHFARDVAYEANALTIVLAAGVTFLWVLRQTGEVRAVRHDQYMDDVVRAGVIATV
ncbi:MAG: cytochrome-c oxidase, cbb3-type subunit I, partial [Paracoccaceae bacterium]